MIELATLEHNTLKVTKTQLAIIVAVIGIIPGVVTALTTGLTQVLIQKYSETTEKAKLEFEERKAAAELYRAALATSDADQRHRIVTFLLKAKLVDENADVARMTRDEIPHWPATP